MNIYYMIYESLYQLDIQFYETPLKDTVHDDVSAMVHDDIAYDDDNVVIQMTLHRHVENSQN